MIGIGSIDFRCLVGAGRWVVDQQVWRLAPCPDTEMIQLAGGPLGSLIDEVIVDTLCVEPPVCPADITANQDAGQCSKTNVTWIVPMADVCFITNVTCMPTNGSTFPIGANAVVCLIKDGEGGTKTCAFNVTVLDTE